MKKLLIGILAVIFLNIGVHISCTEYRTMIRDISGSDSVHSVSIIIIPKNIYAYVELSLTKVV